MHLPKKINYSLKQIAAYEYFITDLNSPAMDKRSGVWGIKCCGWVEMGAGYKIMYSYKNNPLITIFFR